jgi:hypothetical protein
MANPNRNTAPEQSQESATRLAGRLSSSESGCAVIDVPSQRELDTAEGIHMQLHRLGVESLTNLLHSVIAEIERKGGFPGESKAVALFALRNIGGAK